MPNYKPNNFKTQKEEIDDFIEDAFYFSNKWSGRRIARLFNKEQSTLHKKNERKFNQ